MAEVPSYHNSTLSQLALGSVVVFAAGALLTGIGVIFFTLDASVAKEVMGPFTVLLNMFGAAYLAVRRNGPAQPEVKP